jgi:hypothetical protein
LLPTSFHLKTFSSQTSKSDLFVNQILQKNIQNWKINQIKDSPLLIKKIRIARIINLSEPFKNHEIITEVLVCRGILKSTSDFLQLRVI